jgi:hypothetical protein
VLVYSTSRYGSNPHERHVELHLAAKDALDDTRSIAGLAPARRGVHPHQPGPALAPVGGIGDVVEAVARRDREMLLDRDANRSGHGVGYALGAWSRRALNDRDREALDGVVAHALGVPRCLEA